MSSLTNFTKCISTNVFKHHLGMMILVTSIINTNWSGTNQDMEAKFEMESDEWEKKLANIKAIVKSPPNFSMSGRLE